MAVAQSASQRNLQLTFNTLGSNMLDSGRSSRHSRQTLSGWWASYSTTVGATARRILVNGMHARITVILDAGTAEQFSGIRVMIIATDSVAAGLRGRLGRDCPEEDVSYRKFLKEQRAVSREASERGALPSSSLLPLCTIIFELLNTSNAQAALPEFKLIPRMDLRGAIGSVYQVVYDSVRPRRAEQLHAHFCLEFTPSYPRTPPLSIMDIQTGVMHCMRVLPQRRDAPPLPVRLPTPAILRIAKSVISEYSSDWKKALLSLSLVQKAWQPILDVFYETVGGYVGPSSRIRDLPSAGAVARSLLLKPERGVLLKAICPHHYAEFHLDGSSTAFLEALATLLELCPNLKHVELPPIPRTLYARIIRAISQLSKLESFELASRMSFNRSQGEFQRDAIALLDFNDLQNLSNWSNLKELTLCRFWHDPRGRGLLSSTVGIDSAPRLRKLFIDGGATVKRILSYLSAPVPSTLHTVMLHNLGKTDIDLYSFLIQISSSLVHLELRGLGLLHRTEGQHALDVAIPHLRKLQRLVVDGDLATALCISGMQCDNQDPEPYQPRCHDRSIGLVNVPGLRGPELVDALKVTGWQDIVISSPPLLDANTISAAKNVAQARNINFQFFDDTFMNNLSFYRCFQ